MVGLPNEEFSAGVYPIGVVAGSGIKLRDLLDEVHGERSFAEVLGVSGSGIAGHDGVFVFGHCGNVPVILQAGRIHLYEGHTPEKVVSTVDGLHRLGVRTLLLTNAVGGLEPSLRPGQLVAANRIEAWPFRACSISESLVPELIVPGCDAQGAYRWMHGPCYETRAEIAALRALGGMTVGMSLPLEIERCKELGISTGVVSCVTNDCARPAAALTHDEVVATAARASERLCGLLRDYIVREGRRGVKRLD